MGHLKSVSFSLAAILPFLTLTADAADYIVSPGMSIQAAIDAAADGDRILVQPGTYAQRLDFLGKRLEVRGIAGAEFTILDGTAIANCLVQAGQAEPLGTLLAGFTLTNGRGRGFASSYGQDYYGGAIWTGGGSKLTVEDCHIVHNGWNSGGYNNCTFAGGVYSGGSQITLRRCLIADNFAWACGGATLVDGTGSLILFDRCTIVSNASTDFFGPQGGIGMANDGDVIVRDSIVWNNYGNQIDAFGYPYNIGCTASVDYCCVQGGYAGVGNISLNPQLAQWSPLDARLTLTSPCIDSGDPLAPTDLDGTRRDMGAFPFLGGGIQGFCFGDGSIGACPCANQGTASQGCANAVNPAGALLSPSGALSADTLTLNASGLPSTAPCIFLQGTIRIVPSSFGDGILCTGGVLNRLAIKAANGGSVAYPAAGEASIRARSAQLGDTLQPGAVRQYQVYYRDAQETFCPAPQGSTFNITNGVEVTWP